MQRVIVEFQYADDFDRERLEGIAHEARGRFEGLLPTFLRVMVAV